MINIIPLASGKGGVGKTVLAANLGAALAGRGKTVVLIDLDLGASNLHTLLGIKNSQAGLGELIKKKEREIANLAGTTSVDRLFLIPGDNLMPGAANIEFFVKSRIIKGISGLQADYAILDLGSGSSNNVVDFFLLSYAGIVIVRPELTSIMNAYALLKACVFRMLFRSFRKKGPERERILNFASERVEGSGKHFLDLAREMARDFPETANPALEQLSRFTPSVVANLSVGYEDTNLYKRLRDVVAKNLGISLEFESMLPDDRLVPLSIMERSPLVATRPDAPFSRAVFCLADNILARVPKEAPGLFDDDLETEAIRTFGAPDESREHT